MLISFNEALFQTDGATPTGVPPPFVPKEEVKVSTEAEDKKKEADKKVLIQQLGDMGFSVKLAGDACNKVKELKLDLVIDEVQKLQAEELKKNPKAFAPKKMVAWECPSCTFINEDPKPHCEICQGAAPEIAYLPDSPTAEEKTQKLKIEEEKVKESDRIAKADQMEKE